MTRKNEKQKKIDAEITGALFDDFDRFEHFFLGNFKKLIWGGVAVVVTVAAVFGFFAWQRSSVRAQSEALDKARTVAELTDVLAKAGNIPETRFARLRLARLYVADKKYAEASAEYAKIIASGAPVEMSGRMMLDEAYMLEQQNKLQDAAEKFASVGANAAYPEVIRIEGNCQAGRLFKALKNTKEADVYLGKAVSVKVPEGDFALGFWRAQAQYLSR